MLLFYSNGAVAIAKVGSKTSPKSEVEAIDWLVKKQKSPGMPGLIVAKLSAEKGLSAAQGSKQIGTLHSAMEFITN